jgi:hypothetical protein
MSDGTKRNSTSRPVRSNGWSSRHVGRRDAVEPSVVEAFEAGGATVERLPGGGGRPDLAVGFLGLTHFVEVKCDRQGLSSAQVEWSRTWAGEPPRIARTPAQARKLLRQWRDGAPTLTHVLRAAAASSGYVPDQEDSA